MSSILINKLLNLQYEAVINNGNKEQKLYCGYSMNNRETEKQLNDAVHQIFTALLVYDTVYINIDDFPRLCSFFGKEGMSQLLQEGIIKVINDCRDDSYLLIKENIFQLTSFHLSPEATLNKVEDVLMGKQSLTKQETLKMMLLLEKNMFEINTKNTSNFISQELNYDLQTPSVRYLNNYSSSSVNSIHASDELSILRNASILRAVSYQMELNISDVSLDAHAKSYLNSKLRGFISTDNENMKFDTIANIKAIPSLFSLFLDKAVTIADILELRNNISGQKFRDWITSCSNDEIIRTMSEHRLVTKREKSVRWIIPTIAGIVNPILGAGASFADSFLIDRLLGGWHPNIYLDGALKSTLDKKELQHKREIRHKNLQKKYGKINRNDSCPCGSNKKFKVCCY
jgi:hypothetical protein